VPFFKKNWLGFLRSQLLMPQHESEGDRDVKTQQLLSSKAKPGVHAQAQSAFKPALNQNVHELPKSVYRGPSASRPASGISFVGFTSFDDRRGFELLANDRVSTRLRL
jgi:hypothetical protein